MVKFSKIDQLLLPDHCLLLPTDECFFLREYVAYGGYQKSETNQLILNLKKSVEKRGTGEWYYKALAIRQAAGELRSSVNTPWYNGAALVPMPSSKCRTDPLYDDRICDMVKQMAAGTGATVLELLECKTSRPPLHEQISKRNVASLMTSMKVNTALVPQAQQCHSIAIVDDVVTAGTSYRAAYTLIRQHCPQQRIVGFFVARRINEEEED